MLRISCDIKGGCFFLSQSPETGVMPGIETVSGEKDKGKTGP